VKAPGKGGDPRKYKDKHDKEQWLKLKALPNLIYTDGNEFSLWRNGELTARVCRLMRDEVAEQLRLENPALTDLAHDWRALLFPDADEQTFADGYAQAVTFGMLVARARGISVASGVSAAAKQVGINHSLIGGALFVLTLSTEGHETLKTSIGTLTRVLEVVDWPRISKGRPEAWLYFYEEFLSVYDSYLRRKTGSYYTPLRGRDLDDRLRRARPANPVRASRRPCVERRDPG